MSTKKDGEAQVEAREAALRLLARREHSTRELEYKLVGRGHEPACVVPVLEALAEAGLQSDARFAEAWCRQRAGRGYGPVRIRAELNERGIDAGTITEALEGGDFDFMEIAREWAQRRYGSIGEEADFRERARRSQALYRRGFDSDVIRQVLREK